MARKTEPEPEPITRSMLLRPDATSAELGEHEALNRLQEAREVHHRAQWTVREGERLLADANIALLDAQRSMRRISER